MMSNLYDRGKPRQFYQLLTAFIPGQTYNYSPDLSNNRKPSLTVITSRISNVVQDNTEEEEAIKYWSADKIRAEIRRLSGQSADAINLIRTVYDPNSDISISLDVYPRTFTVQKGKNRFITWAIPESSEKPDRVSQAQIVFCNPTGEKGVHEFLVNGMREVELAFPAEENWRNQRIRVRNVIYPLSATYGFGNPPDFDGAIRRFRKSQSEWYFKPILSSSKVVFSPVLASDVFYPRPYHYKDIFQYAASNNGVNAVDVAGDSLLKIIYETPNPSWDIESILKNYNFPDPNKKLIGEKLVAAQKESLTPEIKENYKIHRLEEVPPKRKKEAESTNENAHMRDFGLKSVSYLEPLRCIQMCIGWITGRLDPGVGNDQAPLRPVNARVERADIVYDPTNKNWNVVYGLIDSEGLLFKFRKDIGFDAKHTFAHLLLKVLPQFAGLDEGLLAEQIFESANAMLIYSVEPGEFKAYGLKHVFDNSLKDVLDSVADFLECPFEENDSGCYYCLHKPVGCEQYNRHLSKRELKAAWGSK